LEKIFLKNERQRLLIAALKSKEATTVYAFGPKGVGKTFLNIIYGLDAVIKGEYDRFFVVDPRQNINQHLDFLGRIADKYGNVESIKKFIKDGKIQVYSGVANLGDELTNTLLFIDDIHLFTLSDIMEIFLEYNGRIKLTIAADFTFKGDTNSTGWILRKALQNESSTVVVDFGFGDIVDPIIKQNLRVTMEIVMRGRALSEDEQKIQNIAYCYAPDTDIITVLSLKKVKENLGIEKVPDALIIVKEGYLGRLIGKKGKRIGLIEKEAGMSLRAIEFTLNFGKIIKALHPYPWIEKHINKIDVIGGLVIAEVNYGEYQRFAGKDLKYLRVLDEAFRKLLGLGFRIEYKREEKVKRKRKRKK